MVAVFVAIFVLGAGFMVAFDLERFIDRLGALPAPVLTVAAAVILAGSNFLSYRLSVKFYLRRREGAYA